MFDLMKDSALHYIQSRSGGLEDTVSFFVKNPACSVVVKTMFRSHVECRG